MRLSQSIRNNLVSILIICILTIVLASSINSLSAGKLIEALNLLYILFGITIYCIMLIIGIYLKKKKYKFKGRPFEFGFFVSLFIASASLTWSVVFFTTPGGSANFITSIFTMIIFYGLSLGFGTLHYLLELDGK